MKQTLKIIIGSALVTAAIIKAVPALAEPAGTQVSVVRTADLDLATAPGKHTLDQRLVTAAHQVCDTAPSFDLKGRNAQADCRENVLAAARAKARMVVAHQGGDSMSIAVRD
jgi:UrcA family protein